MEIQQLRYFVAVARTGSFTAAAQSCNVSQPSLSAQIAKLESEMGGKLIERSRQKNRLTARGELFIRRALEILNQVESSILEAQELDSGQTGQIRLGCLPTTGAYVLPPLIKAFRESHPGVTISLSEGSSPVLADMLMDYEVELAIIDQVGMKAGLSGKKLFSEPLFIALPPQHPLAERKTLGLRDLKDQPIILMRRGHGFHTIVREAFNAAGIDPQLVYESSEIETVQALVRAGLGISIVPRMVCVHADIRYLPISGQTPSRTLIIAHRSSAVISPPALQLLQSAGHTLGSIFS